MEAIVLDSGVSTLEPRQFKFYYYHFFQVADMQL